MNSKMLNKALLISFVWLIASALFAQTKFGVGFLKNHLSDLQGDMFIGLPMVVTFYLLTSRIISSLFLSGLKTLPSNELKINFCLFYIFLTKEARAEWKCFLHKSESDFNNSITEKEF